MRRALVLLDPRDAAELGRRLDGLVEPYADALATYDEIAT
jgi:hypothetical protein